MLHRSAHSLFRLSLPHHYACIVRVHLVIVIAAEPWRDILAFFFIFNYHINILVSRRVPPSWLLHSRLSHASVNDLILFILIGGAGGNRWTIGSLKLVEVVLAI